jgi:acetyltransferase-like isoleucine patch superfamily enzyme
MECRFNPQIIIGDNCSIGEYCHITAINKIVIGNGVLTGRWVTITDNSHGSLLLDESDIQPLKRKLQSKGPVVIEDNVWIGDKVTILPDVHIGYGSIIGANAVVTKDVPANCVVGGNPAKIIKNIK